MAMGGSYKGSNTANRGRPYGLMLLLAFGAALLGVMVIHKLRERRIFNLIVKEKDSELISLQLLLQKEREHTKEMKRKNEEMKAKIYFLRTQKMELDRRLLKMQSTIDSLKDEQKAVESALEEKQNEIKMLREANINPEQEHLQMAALTESLKQKEAKIEDLKHRLEYPVKIWSVSSDDPSSPPINLTVTTNTADKDKIQISGSKEASELLHESTNYNNAVNLTRGNGSDSTSTTLGKGDNNTRDDDGNENREGITDRREVSSEEHLQTLENSLEGFGAEGATGKRDTGVGDSGNDHEDKNGNSQDEGAFGAGDENNIANASGAIVNTAGKVSKTRGVDSDTKEMDGEEHKVTRDGHLRQENSQQEGQNHQVTVKDGMKLEMTNFKSARSRRKQTRGRDTRAKVKIWKMLARNRLLESNRNQENNGAESMRGRKFSSNEQVGLVDREEATKTVDSAHADLLGPQKDTKDMENKLGKDGTDHRQTKVDRMLKRPWISQNREVLTKGSLDGKANNIRSKAKTHSLNEVRQQEDQEVSDILNNRHINNKENSVEHVTVARKHERPEEIEAADTEHEIDGDADAADFYRESVSDLVEDKEEYKEETDESEF